MGRNLPTTTVPAVRIIYYPEPATTSSVVYTTQQLAAQREERMLRYMQWRTRKAINDERDRRTRRTLVRIAIAFAVAVVLAVAFGIWLVYRLVSGVQLGDVGDFLLGLFALIVVLSGGIGCGCVTIVRHYH